MLRTPVGELPSEHELITALLQLQYFPAVKDDGTELPPIFTTQSFTKDVATDLNALTGKPVDNTASWVELRTRRFDGLIRRLGIPHPVPYAKLIMHIENHWSDIKAKLGSEQSQIKPAVHPDGRILRMDYEQQEERHSKDTRLAHSHNYLVKADISNCFPSVYSHSIDWSLRGKVIAKQGRRDNSWQRALDMRVRNCRDGETKGLMIGPAVSNLLAELVLQGVDSQLSKKKYVFVRYIDDYTAYAKDRKTAEQFVVDLQRSLWEYRLDLNTRKTEILDLRSGANESWRAEIMTHLPVKWAPLQICRFLRQSEVLAHRYPTRSILKFAVKLAVGLREEAREDPSIMVIDELIRLSAFHPHLAPFVAREIEESGTRLPREERKRLADILKPQMSEAARRSETDVVLWLMYIIRHLLKVNIAKKARQEFIEMDDDLVWIALVTLCPRSRQEVATQVRSIRYVSRQDYQHHWLGRYELRRMKIIQGSDLDSSENDWMQVLMDHNVEFSKAP